MSRTLRSNTVSGLLAAAAFGLYSFHNSSSPLSSDELALLGQAQGDGARLFFQISDERWLQPLAVYATAFAAPFTPADLAGRFAAAAVGSLNVALIFILVQRLYQSTVTAFAAAVLLMLTPAHFAYARLGVDTIFPLPFVLLWLLSLVAYLDGRRLWTSGAAALALGIGIYSHDSAPLTMAFLFAVTLAAIWISGRRDARSLVVPMAVFLAALAVAGLWFARHFDQYPDTFGRWAVHAAHLRSPWDGVQAFVNWNTLGTRLSLYWGFFDPSWLFLDGPVDAKADLRGAAPFLFPTLLGLVAGVSWQLRSARMPVTVLLLASVLVAPLAASTFGRPRAIDDALAVVPLIVALAAVGVASWIAHVNRWWRVLGWGAIALMLIDFAWFYSAYWTP